MMNNWTLGSVSIKRIEEQVGVSGFSPEQFLIGFDRQVFEQYLPMIPGQYLADQHRLVSSVHSWLVRTDKHLVLVDACCGNFKNRPSLPRFHQLNTRFLENLRAAGAQPEDIDIVLCTHLHSDHVGWNTRLENGRWVPTFPNAKYVFSDRDDAFFNPQRNAGLDPERALVYEDSMLPIVRAGQAQVLADGIHAIDDLLRVEPAPGHTPGHVVLKLVDDAARGVFSGDVLHHAVQVYRPDWYNKFCEDPVQSTRTRVAVLEYCADESAVLFPTHFAAPYATAIHRTATGFGVRWVPGSAS